ncbi:hypothetical protein QSH18_11955 [Xanthomonas sp. NCPPB 2654]|uniref:hypothetical protein n=1 Tax=unclassified Xanthomonas TaxID=2643310 RepID=UPI0021DFE4BD|nr:MULTISPECIES: hypothetical protein [unclassified Xanthomonas]MDL5366322.1 hypothetical protein [Xanthomonas sp. NCPPB 2654]UYC22315.1 hypothetical protein NUG20_08525 [Xanthomonas sp. CFBP 8443]
MKPPLILVDGGDVTLFGSESSLVRYVESPDIGEYLVFDSSGKRLALAAEVDEVKFLGLRLNKVELVKLAEPAFGLDESSELKVILNRFISRSFGEERQGLSLSQLIEILESRLGVVD